MKKGKIVLASVMSAAMLFTSFAVIGCNKEPQEHQHTYSTEWSSDNDQHWHEECHTGNKKDVTDHDYDESYKCKDCGYQHTHRYSTTYAFNNEKHWQVQCHTNREGLKMDHVLDTTTYKCMYCDFVHQHTYAGEWFTDASYHYQLDNCGHNTKSEIRHDWNENYVCKFEQCGYEMLNGGINVEKTTTEYVLSAEQTTADISLDDLTVNLARVNETVVREITSDNYTLKFYRGSEEISSLNGVGEGTYNIWVSATIDIGGTPTKCESFVVVYVVDNLESISFDGGITTQSKSVLDSMTSTWQITAHYASGRTKPLNVNDLKIALDTNTLTVAPTEGNSGTNTTATVSYEEENCKGEKTSKAINVDINITATAATIVTGNYSFNTLKNTVSDANASSLALTQDDFKGGNAFLTVVGANTCFYRGPNNNVLEIQGQALKVTFDGVGTLTVGARSTSASNTSSLALYDVTRGVYVAARYTASNVSKDDELNTYAINGSSKAMFTFTILEPGEYIICTVDDVTVQGEIIGTSRHLRIDSIQTVIEKYN